MKGTVFVELLKMAEETFGEETVDEVLDKAGLENDAFTAVGNYPCSELMKIVSAFSDHSGLGPDILQRKFGHWMLEHFKSKFPHFFEDKTTSFSVLEAIEGEIHVEVRKLYPDAQLPHFETHRHAEDHLEMVYSSPRPLGHFCHGLIEACLDAYSETASVEASALPDAPQSTRFHIRLQ